MLTIERIETAPDWLKAIVEDMGIDNAKAVACIRMYGAGHENHPNLRDRSEETMSMLQGLVGNLDAIVVTKVLTGSAMKAFGYDTVGAAHVHDFKILAAV
jgi:hypothetical protein